MLAVDALREGGRCGGNQDGSDDTENTDEKQKQATQKIPWQQTEEIEATLIRLAKPRAAVDTTYMVDTR